MAPAPQNTPYTERLEAYGITQDLNTIEIRQYDRDTDSEILKPFPIFAPHEKGIEITPYTLDRLHIRYRKDEKTGKRDAGKPYSIIRLYPEQTAPDGSQRKYFIPKGQGTPPLIPPPLVDLYEKRKKIKVLYITEGYFKAFRSCMAGLPCIGLVSITCMIDKETGKLHGDILKIIDACKVDRVVWLTDSDCRSITRDEITPDKDLYRRVYGFYNSIQKFQELLSAQEDLKIYFAHIAEGLECGSKGLDDLLNAHPTENAAIVAEALQFDRISAGRYEGTYFVKFQITHGLSAVRAYFLLNDVTQFYLHHVEKRPDLKGKDFRFNGTLYKYDEEGGTCVIKIPKTAADYFRVGDQYYEYVKIPNRYGELTVTYHCRQKSTIREDNGAGIFEHIQKYKAFCNTPDHINYQRIIHNCFNTYHPFMHAPEEGECSRTIDFLKHIFGTDTIQLSDGGTVERWEIGLDYLTLLYKRPQQILPILCLVSKERQTGKTSFAKWLKLLFTENMAIVGNNDFENAFNAHWISKLLVCVDETKIDKLHVVEKIKSLSTSNFTMMNAKGKDQVEMEIFLKFLLLSNNEDNFINIDREEIRFWVIKVHTIPNRVNEIEQQILDEIPAFLHFISTRKMVTKYEERHWFKTEYLATDTLRKIQENSAPTLWKIIKSRIENIFEDHDISTLEMPFTDLRDFLLKGYRYEDGYIKNILKDKGYSLGTPKRGHYPKTIETQDSTGNEKRTVLVNFHARAYTFRREDFTSIPLSAAQAALFPTEIHADSEF